ncbi:ABC transporter permease [Euzebya tangerina]|uniref:ABC transporter permease n=1 Tax=Euzebya tangerina TaxID=591198 RepID=UPI000E311438|nr:ABC transporter permease [Euzebya tangerina]
MTASTHATNDSTGPVTPTHDAPGSGRSRRRLRGARNQGLLVMLTLLVVTFSVISPFFLRLNNFLDMGAVVGILGLMAVAQTLLIVSGGIDISLGSNAAVCAVSLVILHQGGLPIWVAAGLALCIGIGIGLFNGVITVWGGIDPLVTTLGTLSIFQGLAFTISGTRTMIIRSESFAFLGRGDVLGVPMPLLLFALAMGLGLFVERRTRFGRAVYAVGGNLEAARNSGLHVDRIRLVLYVLSGASAAMAGIIVASQLSSAAPQIGASYLLSVITAVILGGASLRGGRGSLVGTLIAVAILGVLQNGFALLQWSAFAQSIVLGIFLIVAVLVDQRLRTRTT